MRKVFEIGISIAKINVFFLKIKCCFCDFAKLHFFQIFEHTVHAETLHLSQNHVLSSLNLISMSLIVQVFVLNRVRIKNIRFIIHQKKQKNLRISKKKVWPHLVTIHVRPIRIRKCHS